MEVKRLKTTRSYKNLVHQKQVTNEAKTPKLDRSTPHAFQSFQENIKNFFLFTTLHGFRYLGESRSCTEKSFWAVILISVFLIGGSQIIELVQNWNESKVVLTHAHQRIHIWDIPFPAITVCSESQLNSTRMKVMESELPRDAYEDVKDYAASWCYSDFKKDYTDRCYKELAMQYTFKRLALACNDTILQLEWINDVVQNYPCQYTQPVTLVQGKCHSINMVPLRQLLSQEFADLIESYTDDKYFFHGSSNELTWDPIEGFKDDIPSNPPWRVIGEGLHYSVKLVVNAEPTNFKQYCNTDGYGAIVEVHNPIDYPTSWSPFYVRPNTHLRLLINPRLITSDKCVKFWNPFDRGCYYPNEKQLKFFKVYTERNCETECRANKTLELCGCVAYYDPRAPTTPICGRSKQKCLRDAKQDRYNQPYKPLFVLIAAIIVFLERILSWRFIFLCWVKLVTEYYCKDFENYFDNRTCN